LGRLQARSNGGQKRDVLRTLRLSANRSRMRMALFTSLLK